jgi:integrase
VTAVNAQRHRLRRSNFRDIWIKATADAGLAGVYFHDLRRTGNTMAAATGASLRELMERMGTQARGRR